MSLINIRLQLTTDEASGKLKVVEQELNQVKSQAEEPMVVKLSAEQALGTIRDVKIALDGVISAVKALASGMNALLDANLKQKQAMQLATHEWGAGAREMANYASEMQRVTNFGDDDLLPLMVKLSQTYKLSRDDVMRMTMGLLDFTEANKATGMTVESAFDLMGRALNGHTEMLGRYGIELDGTRLKQEGVSYLVEKLAEDYNGTAVALADLRTQNQISWGDIKETVGSMLETIITPLLQGFKWLMDVFNDLSPLMQGFVTGLVVAIPLITTTATVITTLTTAVTALKTAINPVAGVISLVVGALSVLGFSIAASLAQTEELTEAKKDLGSEIAEAGKQVSVEAEKFNILSSRLLELKSNTNKTADEKREMKNVIRSLNENYSEYIGNINLETSSYNDLATALRGASEALVQKKIAEIYGQRYGTQVANVADLQIQLDTMAPAYERAAARMNELRASVNWDFMTSDANPMGFNPASYFGNNGEWASLEQTVNQFGALSGRLQGAKNDLQAFGEAYRQAMMNVPDLNFSGSGATTTPPQTNSEEEEQRRSLARMREEFQRAHRTETEQLELEYSKRSALIRRYTEGDIIQQTLDMQGLNDWKADEQSKIDERERAGQEAQFKAQIDYFSNLESLGVSSYDGLKLTMEEYYAWAKENLPGQEQRLILLQLRETNLRWGEARAQREQEEHAHQMELMGIREQFRDRQLELDNNTYQAQLTALEMYYETRRAKLLEAGMTEEQIEKQKAKAMLQLQLNSVDQMVGGLSKVLGTLAGTANQESKKGFAVWKSLALAQATVDMWTSASAAYKSMVGIPIAGPGLAVAAAAAAVMASLANISKIQKTEYVPKAATGMYVDGPSHSQGGVPIEVEGGEFITNKGRVSALGRGFFEFLNFAPLSQVRGALAGLSIPALSVPMPDYAFATGGYAGGGNSMQSLVEAVAMLSAKIEQMGRPNVTTIVQVDPLTGKSVELSEIVEEGYMIRSGF